MGVQVAQANSGFATASNLDAAAGRRHPHQVVLLDGRTWDRGSGCASDPFMDRGGMVMEGGAARREYPERPVS